MVKGLRGLINSLKTDDDIVASVWEVWLHKYNLGFSYIIKKHLSISWVKSKNSEKYALGCSINFTITQKQKLE